MKLIKRLLLLAILPLTVSCVTSCHTTAGSRSQIAKDSAVALQRLYSQNKKASDLGRRAHSVLVFPTVTRVGLGVGGQTGNGTLFRKGHYGSLSTIQADGFYNTSAVSYGLQAGAQQFSYALFMMDETAASKLNQAGGWEFGPSPTVVVVNKGYSGSLSTTTTRKGTYAFFFNQKGLMGGLGLAGTKISRINPAP